MASADGGSAGALHGGHRGRLKSRFTEDGGGGFRDHELLELLLFYSVPRKDTNALAHALINEFGSLDGVFGASLHALMNVDGVGESTAVLIKSIAAIEERRVIEEASVKKAPANTAEMKKYLSAFYTSRSRETVSILCYDNRMRFKKFSVINEGGINSADVNQRKIVEAAINSDSTFIVLAHNHPNGAAKPSAADFDATRSLVIMLKRLEMKMYDHIIIGSDGDTYSMREDENYTPLFI